MLNVALVQQLAQSNSALSWAFAKEITRRLYDLLDELAGTAFSSVRARVARHLLDLSIPDPQDGKWIVTATQQEIADAVGSVREVVARALKELRADRLIEVVAGTTTIVDPAGLHRVSGV
jgi:CRP/FNR family transcriptional regulator, cyclic AMP receptor protein